MNVRKKQVISHAKKLFIGKGYRNTSIQEIIEDSGISRGTFYNYFPSKSELFKAVYDSFLEEYHQQRDELIIGRDLSNIDIFIEQLYVQRKSHSHNQLFALIEDVMVSNDIELKDYLKQTRWLYLNWIHKRLVDIFGVEKKPYLLDCAIILSAMVQHHMHFYSIAKGDLDAKKAIRYYLDRIKVIVDDVSKNDVVLIEPEVLTMFIPEGPKGNRDFCYDLIQSVNQLKTYLEQEVVDAEFRAEKLQIIEFLQDELLHNKEPRHYLVKNMIASLNHDSILRGTSCYGRFREIIMEWLNK
ncbi:TetR/AcrR family transcriptional regulator [Pradoshia sp. D12]|uniref:TetR/AcrR family transcriptional regulator n=1 Tax=Bacillaceae TaxID=186817 RepID=UPI00112D985A|nr:MULTISPECIES: TetR/AcrR family transcriptional regulator [Bacillaceae]QFK70237.1 TetR/AcrR family transcriptional regulator [Pradoshia sp. D12]TPF71017.1 TetR/AcrR family transcriptional regulator [Bacillus sp. D12]